MGIEMAPIHFTTERAEDGSLFGYFCGQDLISQAIYCQETAYKVLKQIQEDFEFSREAIKAAEVCIKKSGLPIESTATEQMQNRINTLEVQVEGLYQLLDQITEKEEDQLDRMIDANWPGRNEGAGNKGPLN